MTFMSSPVAIPAGCCVRSVACLIIRGRNVGHFEKKSFLLNKSHYFNTSKYDEKIKSQIRLKCRRNILRRYGHPCVIFQAPVLNFIVLIWIFLFKQSTNSSLAVELYVINGPMGNFRALSSFVTTTRTSGDEDATTPSVNNVAEDERSLRVCLCLKLLL